ncbi:hypothetical protein AB7M74_011375 [Bradyrhizobium japonicum]
MNSISSAGMRASDFEISLGIKLRTLFRRQPFAEKTMRTLFGPIFLGKAPIERAQTRTATMAPEQKHLPLRKRLSANEAWIEQRLISGRIKCPYDVEIASRCPSGGGESLIGQLLEAPLSLGQPLAVVLSKKIPAVPCVVHYDLGSHGIELRYSWSLTHKKLSDGAMFLISDHGAAAKLITKRRAA